MSPAIQILAAGLLLGQAAEGQVVRTTPVAGRGAPAIVRDAEPERGTFFRNPFENRPVLTRIQGLFGRRDRTAESQPEVTSSEPLPVTSAPNLSATPGTPTVAPAKGPIIIPAPAVQPGADFHRKLPVSKMGKVKSIASKATEGAVTLDDSVSPVALKELEARKKSSPLLPALENRVGRDEKFEWITGQLEKVKGGYAIHYATPETVDPHQGVVALDVQKVDMGTFRSGDLVSVRGQLNQRGRGTPTYTLTSIDLIERPTQR